MKLSELSIDDNIKNAKKLGYDVNNILYHGTTHKFNKFEKAFVKTAAHIYTTPDPRTASYYGPIIYKIAPRIKKMADLIDNYKIIDFVADEIIDNFIDDVRFDFRTKKDMEKIVKSPEYHHTIKDLASKIIDGFDSDDEFEDQDEYEELIDKLHKVLAKEKIFNFLKNGRIYHYNKGKLQDEIMEICFRNGYNVVRFIDHSPKGDSESYVFDDPDDLYIIEEYDG
jgi:hypothetical protein